MNKFVEHSSYEEMWKHAAALTPELQAIHYKLWDSTGRLLVEDPEYTAILLLLKANSGASVDSFLADCKMFGCLHTERELILFRRCYVAGASFIGDKMMEWVKT